jgi:nitroreductase
MDERSREHGARRLATLGLARDDAEGREKLRLMNFEFYGAPCALFLFMDGSLGEWSIFDMGLCAQTLILAAHSLGVESCLQASVTNYAPEIKKFPVPQTKKLVICISLGYPDEKAIEYLSQPHKTGYIYASVCVGTERRGCHDLHAY